MIVYVNSCLDSQGKSPYTSAQKSSFYNFIKNIYQGGI